MACPRCRIRPVLMDHLHLPVECVPGGLAPEHLRQELDPLAPSPLAGFGATLAPRGYDPARVCSCCGVVYYPRSKTPPEPESSP